MDSTTIIFLLGFGSAIIGAISAVAFRWLSYAGLIVFLPLIYFILSGQYDSATSYWLSQIPSMLISAIGYSVGATIVNAVAGL